MTKKRHFLKTFQLFLFPVLQSKMGYTKYLLLGLLWGFNGITHVLFLENIIQNLETSSQSGFYDSLLYYGIYIGVYELLNYGLRNWSWVRLEPRGIYHIYDTYLRKYISLDNNEIELIGTGKLIGILYNGIRVWSEILSELIEKCSVLFVSVFFTLYTLSKIDIKYTLIFFLFCFISFCFSSYINKKLHIYRGKRYENANTLLRYFTKVIMSKTDIVHSGKIDNDLKKMYLNLEDEASINVKMSPLRYLLRRSSPCAINIMVLCSFWYLGSGILDGSVKMSTLVGVTGAFIIMQNSIAQAISFYVSFTKKIIHVEKIFDFFESTQTIKGYEEGNNFEYKKGDIQVKNLCYAYVEGQSIFKNFHLQIDGGQVVALVGPSGSGKSTLTKLLSGYIQPNSGEIIVDGQKLSNTSLKSYYKHVGYLTQEPSVFDGTVFDNLTYAMEQVSENNSSFEKSLKNVITLAKCEFIYDLPKGLYTEVGERGVKLSGGQKQRIAIAKILLKDPKIIMLDEPTSALDSFSEEHITQAMRNLFKNRTVIVVAHRLQTVKYADKILFFKQGQILEKGTHKELVRQKGSYKKMLDLQAGF